MHLEARIKGLFGPGLLMTLQSSETPSAPASREATFGFQTHFSGGLRVAQVLVRLRTRGWRARDFRKGARVLGALLRRKIVAHVGSPDAGADGAAISARIVFRTLRELGTVTAGWLVL